MAQTNRYDAHYACMFGRTNLALSRLVLWSNFKGMSDPFAIVANCCTHPHPSPTTRLDPFENDIPFQWATGHH